MTRRSGWILLAMAALVSGGTGCDGAASPSGAPTPTVEPRAVPSAPPSADARTLRSLIEAQPETPTLTLGEEVVGDGYVTSEVSYESEGFTIRGVMHTPRIGGPYPGIVFVHGAVDPDTWSPLAQNVDEQRRLVAAGYVVLVPDLRNHGDSDDDPRYPTELEIGTTADVVNAARALAARPVVDPSRIAVVGNSFGGVLAFNTMVVAPDVAAAVVAMAPGSLSTWQNISHFLPPDSPAYLGLTELRGTPDTNPAFWADVSAVTFLDRATAPLLIVQGTADEVVPPDWAAETRQAFEDAGRNVELVLIEGSDHAFEPARDEAWSHVLAFLATHLAP